MYTARVDWYTLYLGNEELYSSACCFLAVFPADSCQTVQLTLRHTAYCTSTEVKYYINTRSQTDQTVKGGSI